MMWGWDGMGWGGMMVMLVLLGLFALLLLGLVVAALVAFLRRPGSMSYQRTWGGSDPALQALRERYARGEITKEQYDAMRADLERE